MSRNTRLLPPVILGIVALVAVAYLVPFMRFVLTIALAKALAVMGILLLLRAGQVSFGHALYIATSAYTVAFMGQVAGLGELFILLPLGMLASAVLGLVVGLFVTRYREIFFGMLNLAFSMVFYSVLEKAYHITKGTDGIRVGQPSVAFMMLPREQYEWVMFATATSLVLAAGLFCHRYLQSPAGQALSAIKTRETRLEFAGLSARHALLLAYVLSAALAGAGGAIIAMTTRHVTPLLGYWTLSGELVFAAILGGTGSVLGPVLGAVAFESVRVYAAAAFPNAWQMIMGVALLALILFASRGVWGIYEDAMARARRR